MAKWYSGRQKWCSTFHRQKDLGTYSKRGAKTMAALGRLRSLNFGNGVSEKAVFVMSRIFFTAPASDTMKGRFKKAKGILNFDGQKKAGNKISFENVLDRSELINEHSVRRVIPRQLSDSLTRWLGSEIN